MENKYTKSDVKNYLDLLYDKIKNESLVDKNIRNKILKRIEDACIITKYDISNLLNGLDFKPNDFTIEGLESFIAELRTIFWLNNFGFKEICPLQAKNKSKQPDFLANYKNKICAIEVFCLTQAHEQKLDENLGVCIDFDAKFISNFINKKNKKEQLDSVNDAEGKILLCVLNSNPVIALNTKSEFESHLKNIYEELNWGSGYFIGLLTGKSSEKGLDDMIYPKFNL